MTTTPTKFPYGPHVEDKARVVNGALFYTATCDDPRVRYEVHNLGHHVDNGEGFGWYILQITTFEDGSTSEQKMYLPF